MDIILKFEVAEKARKRKAMKTLERSMCILHKTQALPLEPTLF